MTPPSAQSRSSGPIQQYLIPPRYLPLPTPLRIPHHRVSNSHEVGYQTNRPIRRSRISSHAPIDPLTDRPRERSEAEITERFNCSCGANPLNNPHNLADLVRHQSDTPAFHSSSPTPDSESLYPMIPPIQSFSDLGGPPPHPAPGYGTRHTPPAADHYRKLVDPYNPRVLDNFHKRLWETLPHSIQTYLSSTALSNFRNVTLTNPESPLLTFIQRHFPGNYHERPDWAVRQDADYKEDMYDTTEWESWNWIHRQDLVIMNPRPYVENAYKNEYERAREAALEHATVGDPSPPLNSSTRPHLTPPGVDLMPRHPALPVMLESKLALMSNRKSSELNPMRVIEYYEAFVGRTVSRALETWSMPWQEPVLGRYILKRYGLIHVQHYSRLADDLHNLTLAVM